MEQTGDWLNAFLKTFGSLIDDSKIDTYSIERDFDCLRVGLRKGDCRISYAITDSELMATNLPKQKYAELVSESMLEGFPK